MGFNLFGLGKKKKALTKEKLQLTDRTEKLYVSMSTEDLGVLSDNERVFAVLMRIEKIVDSYSGLNDALELLNDYQRYFYAVYSFDGEVNNGGIMQFFTNSSRATLPYVSDGLREMGAAEHQKVYDLLISRYEIDVDGLAAADEDELEEYLEEYGRYPLENFDASYYTLTPLQKNIEAYVKDNIQHF